ncbi:MAG TPA: tRNA (N6-isopentenyl adenosine(37)-C2)-methylthiotransferase MiaB [Polyangiaceae bacterium]|nr:tRNA (N6-isopentenyl adenosine(37)-C2)-methylthiotransferase MiaB [Polyangiaceae bacterium]
MPKFALVTFGCQMNQHDSERIGEVLRGAGYSECERPDQADLVLLNTCSVREKAEQKLRSEVGRLGMLKQQRPDLLIAVAGCVAQQEGERLMKRMPQIDLLIGPDQIPELPQALEALDQGAAPRLHIGFDLDEPRFLSARPEPGTAAVSAFVTVMKGCDERCSFCIVPTTRGPERYRPAPDIVAEIARLVAAGTREITLLGQTVNSYRDPLRSLPQAPRPEGDWNFACAEPADESEFPALLRRIVAEVPELVRLRYTSPHPRHLTPSLIRAHAELEPLVRHLHLPLQSGSDRVLKRMIRRYTISDYRERVRALRAAVPGLTLSTDVIVGFPGETLDDFAATVRFVDEIGFTGLFGFKYSARPFTPALRLGDDIPEAEKSRRLEELFALSDAYRRVHLESRVGHEEAVLVEGRGRGADFSGRSERNEIVHIRAPEVDPTGHLVRVRIQQAFNNSLSGVLSDERGLPKLADRAVAPARRALPVLSS